MAASTMDVGQFFGSDSSDHSNDSSCYFNRTSCSYKFSSCGVMGEHQPCQTRIGTGYSDDSAAFVLICAILVFFMKAGFMLLESAFADTDDEKRQIVIIKNMDLFASAFGYFLIGGDFVAATVAYDFPVQRTFFSVQEPLLWFFKFSFASNAATLVGGCLIKYPYKLRLPVAFLNAFLISGVLHPLVTRFLYGTHPESFLSPFRFCRKPWRPVYSQTRSLNFSCSDTHVMDKLYAVDFAGGGSVHLLGGLIGLILCLFAKVANRRNQANTADAEKGSKVSGFWNSMYPVSGGEEGNIENAALGVFILWFGWFAFNCGSTEGIGGGHRGYDHSTPGRIAMNMIICCSSGGCLAVLIAAWAQVKYQAATVNANEIANTVLSCLVAISSSCSVVTHWGAVLLGILTVIAYHFACFIEYKFNIPDTARVFPVHGMSALLGLLVPAMPVVMMDRCLLHGAYEAITWCSLRLPCLSFGDALLAQLLAILVIVCAALCVVPLYLLLFIIPVKLPSLFMAKILLLNYKNHRRKKLVFSGSLLFSGPEERRCSDADSSESPRTKKQPPPAKGPSLNTTLKSAPKDGTLTSRSQSGSRTSTYRSHSSRVTDQARHSHIVEVEIHQEMSPFSASLNISDYDSLSSCSD